MKIVIISGLGPRDRVVVKEIVRNFDNVTLIHLVAGSKKETGINFANWFKKKGKKILKKMLNIRISSHFNKIGFEDLECERIQFSTQEINTEKGEALIQSLQPDILFTSQAPILKDHIIRIPTLAAINNHYGMAPQYRGNDTLFWALYHQDYEYVGGCIHYISKGVDTGNILAQVRPKIIKGDGEVAVNIKTTLLLAMTVPKVLEVFQNNPLPKGKIQLEKGRNFKTSERTLYADIKFLILKTMRSSKIKDIPEKVEFFI